MTRKLILQNLIEFNSSVKILEKELSNFDWDFDGEPTIIYKHHIENSLKSYCNETLSKEDLEAWANLIECREDLDYEKPYYELIETIIYELANPDLCGDITVKKCTKFLNDLDYK